MLHEVWAQHEDVDDPEVVNEMCNHLSVLKEVRRDDRPGEKNQVNYDLNEAGIQKHGLWGGAIRCLRKYSDVADPVVAVVDSVEVVGDEASVDAPPTPIWLNARIVAVVQEAENLDKDTYPVQEEEPSSELFALQTHKDVSEHHHNDYEDESPKGNADHFSKNFCWVPLCGVDRLWC